MESALGGNHEHRVALDDDGVIHRADRPQGDALFFRHDLRDGHPRAHRIAGPDRRTEAQALTEINGAGAGQDRGQYGGDEARRQKSVGDGAFESGLTRVLVIEVDRVVVALELGEGGDIVLGNRPPDLGAHTDVEILQTVS